MHPREASSATPDRSDRRRRRVIVGAYACGPGDESEAGAGWAFTRAAAQHHDVWLVTRQRFEPAISAALRDDPDLAHHLTVDYLELSPRLMARKRRAVDVYWYYVLWQRRLARRAAALHAEVGFDVAHHVTFAADWLPCGLRRLAGVPLVWGPVGGATYLPWRLARWVGAKGVLVEAARSIITRVARRFWGDPLARRAAIVVAQNPQVGRRFRAARHVVVEPNAAIDLPPFPSRPRVGRGDPTGDRVAIFVGRLTPWKGCRLAITALSRPALRGWRLDVYGEGAERPALEALAQRLGVADRIAFLGLRPRAEVLDAVSHADAMIFPSLHDSAGWAVGEASATGCPVVCLDIGGPPLLAGPNARVVPVSRHAVDDIAVHVAAAGAEPGVPYDRWGTARMVELTRDWYAEAEAGT